MNSLINNLIFKIADTRTELEQAYRLVHDTYVEKGYIEPQPSGLHLKLNNALPTTTTFVAKLGDRVVTTVTLFPDSPLGLPLDELYKIDADTLRKQNYHLAEVGALASAPDFRDRSSLIMLYLSRMLYHYAWRYLKSDYLIITVHAKHQSFYKSILLFEQIGEVKPYKAVNNQPTVLLQLDIKASQQNYQAVYQGKSFEKDLHNFFFIRDIPCIHLPEIPHPVNVWTNDLLTYFFCRKTELFMAASYEQLDFIKSQHMQYRIAV